MNQIVEKWKSVLHTSNRSTILVGLLLFIGLVILLTFTLPEAPDWHNLYRPGALAMIQGKNPFDNPIFYNAPWVLIPMIPLLLLPEAVGRAILTVATLVILVLVAHRFGARPVGIVFILLSPPVFQLMLDGNIDWIVALGFILPPQIGLFLLAVKPQTGMVVGIFWLVEAYQKGRIREVFRVFLPVTLAFVISFLMYGFWPLRFSTALELGGNASLWPMSIPIGLALTAAAMRKHRVEYAMAASPCLTPYALLHSWISPLLAIAGSTTETICAVAGLWMVVIIRALGG